MNADEEQQASRLTEAESPEVEFRRRLREGIGIGIRRAVVVGCFTFVLMLATVPNMYIASDRAKVSRARTDMRSIGIGLEAYHADHGVYPPGTRYWGALPPALTTPVSYLLRFPANPFSQKIVTGKRLRLEVSFWVGPVIMAILALGFLLGAWLVFRRGTTAARFGVVLTLGFAGLSWLALAAIFGCHLWNEIRGDTIGIATSIDPTGGAVCVAAIAAVLGFGSGVRKAMKGASWWSPPLIVQTLIILAGCALFAGSGAFAFRLADKTLQYGDWRGPSDEHFLYATDGRNHWILWSGGPDGTVELPPSRLLDTYKDQSGKRFWDTILPLSYDPTNGTVSRGDIWRVKQ